MQVFDHPAFSDHEQIIFCHDPAADLHAIIALHSTALGPAAGGCRMHPYPDTEAALQDVLRLSKGMSYKNAMAGLALGGGKSVIIADPTDPRKRERLRAFTKFVQQLNGQYWTAIDVGVSLEDTAFMAETCDYVFALLDPAKDRKDTSWFTSLGGFISLKATVQHRFGTTDLKGIRVAVQGCGKTGAYLCEMLHEAGAKLVVSDVQPAAVQAMVDRFGAQAVAPEAIYRQAVEVFAPCAMGGILNDSTLPQLQAKAVCGIANNQLAEAHHGNQLLEQGILYAPDYIANAGGVLYATEDIFGTNNEAASVAKIHQLGETLQAIFIQAENTGRSTQAVADELAKARIAGTSAHQHTSSNN